MTTLKIAIPGGTGQVGTLLARAFHRDGHDVAVLGRSPAPAPWRVVRWDPTNVAEWSDQLDGADVVINLAGRSVNCRYTPGNRQEIKSSGVVFGFQNESPVLLNSCEELERHRGG